MFHIKGQALLAGSYKKESIKQDKWYGHNFPLRYLGYIFVILSLITPIGTKEVIVLQKNHTHVKKVEHTSEFPFGIYWWTLKNPKNQTFEKMKKIAGDIIILHMCTKNHNHMRYSSWDTEWDKFVLSFWTILCPSTLPPPPHFIVTTQKTKILKKWKKHLEMSSF